MTKKQGIIVLALLAGGLGAPGWWIFHPRPLAIGFKAEPATTKLPLMGDPLAIQLSILPAAESPPHNAVLSSSCEWKFQSVRYRRDKNAPWRDIKPTVKEGPVRLFSQSHKVGYSDIFFPLYQQDGEWKSVVRADVNIQTLSGRWHGEVTHEINDVVTAADLKRRSAQRAAVKRRKYSDKPQLAQSGASSGTTMLVPGKRYIAKIQWSADAGQTWRDAPAANQGFLSVAPYTTLGLRAIKADPNAKWPDAPKFYPYWEYEGEKFYGEQVFLGTQPIAGAPTDMRTATVHCGQKMAVKIRVLPSSVPVKPKSKKGSGKGSVER